MITPQVQGLQKVIIFIIHLWLTMIWRLAGYCIFFRVPTYWKNMLVIITEDDPQGGVDHIDAHRSILMLAGPYVKHGYVSHTHANFGSILKTDLQYFKCAVCKPVRCTATVLQDFLRLSRITLLTNCYFLQKKFLILSLP